MDGVIFEGGNRWMELHKAYGTLEEGKALTKRYLTTDYDRLVEEVVVRLWKGRDARPFLNIIAGVKYNPGVKETIEALKQLGLHLAIISSGPKRLVQRAMEELGIEQGHGNDLVIEDGKVAGRAHYDDGTTCWPIGNANKEPYVRKICEHFSCSLSDTVFIGDDLPDLGAFEVVGLPIAFNDAPEELIAVAKARGGVHVKGKDLRGVLEHITS